MAGFGRQTMQLTLATIVQKALAFLYFVLVARFLGPEDTGAYTIVLSVASMVGLAADIGCTPVLIRDLVGQSVEKQRSLLASVWRLKAQLAIVGAIVGWLLAWALGYATAPLAIWLAIVLAICEASYTALYGMWRAQHQLRREALGIILGQGVIYVVGLGLLYSGANWVALPLAIAAGSLFHVVWAGWRWKGLIREAFFLPRQERVPLLYVWQQAIPFALSATAVKLLSTADIWVLKAVQGELQVGQYGAISKFVYAFQFLPLTMIAGLYPALTASIVREETPEARRELLLDAMRYLAAIGWPICVGMIMVAPVLLPRIYDDSYSPGLAALPGLAVSLLCIFMDVPLGALLNASKRQKEKMFILLAGLIVNVVSNLVLIPAQGIAGAGTSAGIAFLFMLLLSVWRVHAEIPRVVQLLWQVNVRAALAALLMAFALWLLLPALNAFAILAGGLVYVIAGFLLRAWDMHDVQRVVRMMR